MPNTSEEILISLSLKSSEHGETIAQVLSPNEFNDAINKQIWEKALAIMAESGSFPTAQTLLATSSKQQADRIDKISKIDERWEMHKHHLSVVKESHIRKTLRSVLERSLQNIDSNPESVIDDLSKNLYLIDDQGKHRSKTYEDAIEDVYARLNKSIHKNSEPGIKIPYKNMEVFMPKGLPPGGLILIAGRPSCGKTAFSKSLAFDIAKTNVPTLFFSIEMTMEQVEDIFLSAHANIDLERIYHPSKLSKEEWKGIQKAKSEASKIPMFIEESYSVTIEALHRRLSWYVHTKDVKVIVLDYAQLIIDSLSGSNKEYDAGRQISERLRIIARDLGVPIIVAAQLNREVEKRRDKRPMMSDIRGAGQWEQDASVVMGLYRDEVYNEDSESVGILEVNILKNRFGPAGRALFYFNKPKQMISPCLQQGK